MKYILASKSPRRKEILEGIGLPFEIVTSGADEHSDKTEPCEYVAEIAAVKGRAVLEHLRSEGKLTADTLIIAADTVVVADGEILGKPRDRDDAARMIRKFSGRSHKVISGVALFMGDRVVTSAESTEVVFDEVPEEEILAYIDTDEPYDKAGAYAIQGRASLWIRGIVGDYFNVVGFPVKKFNDMLKEGFSICLADEIGNAK